MPLAMTFFTCCSGEGTEIVPDDTEVLIVAETVQTLPIDFCCNHRNLQQVVVVLSSGIQSIPKHAFYDCRALRVISIPFTVKAIGDAAFHFCESLTGLRFPEGLETIGKNSFTACGFTHLRIPGSLPVIEEKAFCDCISLLYVNLFYGLKVVGQDAFSGCGSLREIIGFPSTVEVIGASAFSECNSLTAVDLPKGLKKIGEYAFSHANSLQSVCIPSSVEHIEKYTFYDCLGLKALRLELGLETIGGGAFYNCPKLRRVSIPQTVNIIDEDAFYSCSSLGDVVFVDGSLTLIGARAFARCYELSSVYIPSSVGYVGDEAFHESGLVSVEIPKDSSTTFGSYVFSECDSLANIALPTWTGNDEMFDDCSVLDDTYVSTSVIQGIRSRFHGYPVHEACYYAASMDESEEMLTRALQMQGKNTQNLLDNLADPLGMTPFHVLMSAAKKRPDLLMRLLEVYPSNVLGFTNLDGDTALDYLLINWTMEAAMMLRIALDKWMIARMESWGLPHWQSKMSRLVESVFKDNPRNERYRYNAIDKACNLMARYEVIEAISLSEMWLWKMNMQSMQNGAKIMTVDRESSRARCGATFILPTVVEYLQVSDEQPM